MKLTKKQIAALERIMERERCINEKWKRDGGSGFHPSRERYAVTDGTLVVLFDEPPADLPEAARMDFFEEYVYAFHREDYSVMVETPPTVEECKRTIREWKKMTNLGKPQFPRMMVETVNEKGERLYAYFNAQLLLDALEAMGPYTDVFIGPDKAHRSSWPCLVVKRRMGRESWQSRDESREAFLLPCRSDR